MNYLLSLKFRQVAAHLQVLDIINSDYSPKNLLNLAKKYCSRSLNYAQKKRYDLEDSYTLWEILGIDAVICLENEEGKFYRVAVNLAEGERNIGNLIYKAKNHNRQKLMRDLNCDQYWIINIALKNFNSEIDWIDILYQQIDKPKENSNYRLVKV